MKKQIYIKDLSQIPSEINVKKDDRLYFYFYYTGGNLVNKDITINLLSEKAKVYLKGAVYLGSGELNLNVWVNHKKGHNKAFVAVKTVLAGEAIFNFQGLINIYKKSHGVDSYLKQNTLVTSPKSICNSSPQLIIGANDVKASHGATVSGFNLEDLFYLQTRGYSKLQAKKLLSESFLVSVFGKRSTKVFKKLNISNFF